MRATVDTAQISVVAPVSRAVTNGFQEDIHTLASSARRTGHTREFLIALGQQFLNQFAQEGCVVAAHDDPSFSTLSFFLEHMGDLPAHNASLEQQIMVLEKIKGTVGKAIKILGANILVELASKETLTADDIRKAFIQHQALGCDSIPDKDVEVLIVRFESLPQAQRDLLLHIMSALVTDAVNRAQYGLAAAYRPIRDSLNERRPARPRSYRSQS